MMLKPIIPEVLITGRRFPQFTSTVTLLRLESPEINILFDCGSPYEQDVLKKRLKETGLTPGEIHTIIFSHWHIDHCGAVALFPGAHYIFSAESFKIQQDLYKAIVFIEGKGEGFHTFMAELVAYFKEKKQFQEISGNLPKIRAMANITYRNCDLIKGMIKKYEKGEVRLLNNKNTLLYQSISLFCVSFHTRGDLVAVVLDKNNHRYLVTGDVVISKEDIENNNALEEILRLANISDEYTVIPGHGSPFTK